jgi:glycosyltransferase involved in cell wall biosynthesis
VRISFIGPVPPFRGGISQHSALLVAALREVGHEVVVYSWAAQYPGRLYPGDPYAPGAQPFPGTRFALRWWDPTSWVRVGRAVRGSDALVFPWVTPFQAIAYRTLITIASTPAIVVVHNPMPHERRRVDEVLTRLVFGRVRGAVALASGAADDLRARFPGLEVVVAPIPSLVPLEPAPLPSGPPWRLLFFGFVRPYKGLDVALETVAVLSRRMPVELTIAGEFWEPVEPWKKAITKAGIAGQVHLRASYVPDAEIQDLFASHHVVLAPYRSATQSAIVPMAYAAGRPVVATRVGGLSEQVIEGRTGALADPGDAVGIADAVERVLARLPEFARGAEAYGTRSNLAETITALARPHQ